MEVKEIIDKVYETIDSLYEDGKLRPYMRVYVDKDIIPEMFKSITGTYTDNNPDTYIFKYRSTYNTDIEFVGIDSKKILEYYPSNEGLKNIYSKFLKFGSIEDLDNLILLYTNDIRKKVIDSYIEDGEDEEMAQFIVDYFECIYGKRGEEE